MGSATDKLEFDVDLPGLLNEVLCNESCSILSIPIAITKGILEELAETAIEIDDDRLNLIMVRLGLYDFDKSASKRLAMKTEILKGLAAGKDGK